MLIQAIETSYKGYRFRSRTEARWAVFLDAMGKRWEYESQGFVLSNGRRYLPDFEIKSRRPRWLEVKGLPPTAEERENCALLADATDGIVELWQGAPGPEAVGLVWFGKGLGLQPGPARVRWSEMNIYADDRVERAVARARSARFEHGETPA